MADDFTTLIAGLRQAMAPVFDKQRDTWEREGPAATARFEATGATLKYCGGNCPVQAEGVVDGQPFYFRARGDGWSLEVGPEGSWHGHGAWEIEREYGAWPDAGWMDRHEALDFIVEGIAAFRADPDTLAEIERLTV